MSLNPSLAAEPGEPVRQLADLPQRAALAVVSVEISEHDLAPLAAGLQLGDAQDLRDRPHVRDTGHPEPRGDDPGRPRHGEEVASPVVAEPPNVQLAGIQPGQAEGESF